MRLPDNDRDTHLLAVIVLWILGFAVYLNSFPVPFVFDDYPNIRENPAIRIDSLGIDALRAAAIDSHASRRPVANISFALNYLLGGYDVKGYHLVNVLVHVANGVLVYFLSLLLLARDRLLADRAEARRRMQLAALLAAALFVVHPVQVQAVTYIVQRMTGLATLFYMIALLLYLLGRASGDRSGRAVLWVVGALSWLLALGSKEIAATLPAIVVVTEWLFFRDGSRYRLGVSPWLLLSAAVASAGACILYLGTDQFSTVTAQYAGREFTPGERMLTELRVIVHYLSLVGLPAPGRLSLEHAFEVSRSILDPITTLAAAAVIAALVATALALVRRRPVIAFSILWFLITLSVESSFIGLELAFEHRLYLPMFGPALALGYLASLVPARHAAATATCALTLVVTLAAVTFVRNGVWQDPARLWAEAAAKAPQSRRAHNNLGRALLERGDVDGAASAFEEAIRIDPEYAEPQSNLGTIHARAGRYDEAMALFARAIVFDPDYVQAYNNLGVALLDMGRPMDAAVQLAEAVNRAPGYARGRGNLARALFALEKPEEACNQLRIALDQDPLLAGLEAERKTCGLISKLE